MVPVEIKNGNPPDSPSFHEVFLRSGIIAQANVQKTNFIADSVEFNFQSLDNLADGDAYLVDGFGIPSTFDYTNSTIVADNEDTSVLSNDKTRYVSHRAFSCKVLDNFNDSSVDSGIWSTTGAVTENTEKISISGSSSIISDGVSGFDARTFSADSEFIFHSNINIGALSTSSVLSISNGATDVTIYSQSLGGSGSPPDIYQDTIRVKIDKSLENAHVSVNGGAFGGAIDISSVTTNWYIKMVNSASASSTLHFLGYVDGDGSTVDYVSADKTFSSTKTAGTITWDFNGSDSDISGFISSNGGNNYTAAVKDTWTQIGTTSTTGKIKLTITTPSSLDATSSTSDIFELKVVGGYFDG